MDSRYFIIKNKRVTYEFSEYAAILGADFVEGACSAVCMQRNSAGVTEKTWLDNYVIRLKSLFENLMQFLTFLGTSELQLVETFSHDHWLQFGHWYSMQIQGLLIAPKTKSKLIFSSNKLFKILSAASVIPVIIELNSFISRKIARDGQSRFTERGSNNKPKLIPIITPYIINIEKHCRSYDYQPYQSLAPYFLSSIVPILKIFYERLSAGRAKKLHNVFVNFMQHLSFEKIKRSWPTFFKKLKSKNFKEISNLQWEIVIYHWRDKVLVDSSSNISLSHSKVVTLGQFWRLFFSAGLVAEVSIVGFKNGKRATQFKARRSLAQLTSVGEGQVENEHLVWTRLEPFFDNSEQQEAHEFISSLCSTLPSEVVQNLSVEGLIEEIHKLNAFRLHQLREYAEDEFLHWYTHWEVGRVALNGTIQSSDELIQLLDSQALSTSERRRNSARLLLKAPDNIRLGNVLQYILATKEGVISGINGRYHHLARSFGGKPQLHAYLHPHPNATLALWLLLLIDTGANCEVVREMPWNCVNPSSQAGYRTIQFACKDRAGGKSIADELVESPLAGQKLSTVQAIELYQTMAKRYRSLANEESKNKLFLYESRGIIHGLTEWIARAWFSNFLNRYEIFSGWNAKPSMIRPSMLMSVQHQNADSVVVAQIMADHTNSSTTIVHYTGRTPTKLRYNLLIREFQERYQAVIIASIDGAAAKLGLSEDEFKRILSDAARTGLGVACLNPLAGVQLGTNQGQDCTRLDACCNCEMHWVVATRENIVDLILFNEHLKMAQVSANQEYPDSWEKRWLPWLVFSDIALTKLSQGETARIFVEASELTSERRSHYQKIPLL